MLARVPPVAGAGTSSRAGRVVCRRDCSCASLLPWVGGCRPGFEVVALGAADAGWQGVAWCVVEVYRNEAIL
jgi:hypothetical protein